MNSWQLDTRIVNCDEQAKKRQRANFAVRLLRKYLYVWDTLTSSNMVHPWRNV